MMRRMAGPSGPGGQIFNVGKSRAQLFDAENKVKITFDNVAGLDEAKEEIQEIVEFLKNPSKFTKLGGKIPVTAELTAIKAEANVWLAHASIENKHGVESGFFTEKSFDKEALSKAEVIDVSANIVFPSNLRFLHPKYG